LEIAVVVKREPDRFKEFEGEDVGDPADETEEEEDDDAARSATEE
jgi:hypothetical protein